MKVVDIDTICKKENVNTSVCITLLKSKQGADLLTLAQHTIDVLYIEVNNTIKLIKTLIHQYDKDPEENPITDNVLIFLANRMGGDYGGINEKVLSILTDYECCINGASSSEIPYPDKSLLPKYAKVVDDVASILFAISEFLIGNV
ncbi:uncharacterized protein [Cicer arietinum]|uniref:uncharacterized protein n=1 Tax=Cicer arietinum TaxID=3827 RepID=UPI003CC636C2